MIVGEFAAASSSISILNYLKVGMHIIHRDKRTRVLEGRRPAVSTEYGQ